MRNHLLSLRAAFPNRAGLHARIDTLLAESQVIRIGVVPLADTRTQVAPVLNSIIADPIDDRQWFPQVCARQLSKDVMITQSASFDFVETRNSLTVYPVPFPGPPTEILECLSLESSAEHLDSCHFHLFASSNPAQALVTPTASEHPQALVLDSPALCQNGGQDLGASNPLVGTPVRVLAVDTAGALKADDILRSSPKNISKYLELHKCSGINALKKTVFNQELIKRALLQSVFLTCDRVISNTKASEKLSKSRAGKITRMRQNWAADAHRELQSGLLPEIDRIFSSTLGWYKLYTKVDDVESLAYPLVAAEFLPKSRESVDYMVGRIDQAAPSNGNELSNQHSAHVSTTIWRNALVALQNESMRLHNAAIRAVASTTLGLQLPIAVVSGLGWYFADFSATSMFGLAGLGLITGMKRLQRSWIKSKNQFKSAVESLALDAIQQSEVSLYKLCESQAAQQHDITDSRERLLSKAKEAARSVNKSEKQVEH